MDAVLIDAMATPKTKPQTQVAVRIPDEWLPRLDALALALSRPGIDVARADAMRAAMAKGIEALEAEFGLAPAPAPAKAPKGAKPKRDA